MCVCIASNEFFHHLCARRAAVTGARCEFQNIGPPCAIEKAGGFDWPSATKRAVSITAGLPYAKEFAQCIVASGKGEFDAKVQVVGADGKVRERVVRIPSGKFDFRVDAVLSQLSVDKLDV
jgi:hypothetical protein